MTHGHCNRLVAVLAIGLVLLSGTEGFAQEPIVSDSRAGVVAPVAAMPLLPEGFVRVSASGGQGRASAVSRETAETLARWAKAWSNKDVEQYFSFYDSAFFSVEGESRQQWQQHRRQRLLKPESFVVELSGQHVALRGDAEALVELVQLYRSTTDEEAHVDKVIKEFLLVRRDGKWRILSERTLQVVQPGVEQEQALVRRDTTVMPSARPGMGDLFDGAVAELQEETSGTPLSLTGFWDMRFGVRTQNDPNEKRMSLAETRLHTEFEKDWDSATAKFSSDILVDAVADSYIPDIEEGSGVFDIREASLAHSPADNIDVKIGRQPLTWGTGDLIFINDLFPKDWNSFLLGRDVAYLKAPSDALKVSWFNDLVNLDLAYTPRFDADRFVDGSRISFFNPITGDRVGEDDKVRTDQPDQWFRDDELALRLFRNLGGLELAAYAYNGFWKSPGGVDSVTGKAIFPDLAVYGASIRGVVGEGIANMEIGYYDSRDDVDGDDPFVRNSETRVIVGYEREIARELTGSVQYYLEHMQQYDDYRKALSPGVEEADENRHLVTLRLTKFLMNQNLIVSLFTFYSPSDKDAYLRPKLHYKANDFWTWEVGGNIFTGKEKHTFFGQFEKNTNVYFSSRYSF